MRAHQKIDENQDMYSCQGAVMSSAVVDDSAATGAADADAVLGRVASLLRRADLALLAAKEPPLRKAGVSGSLYSVLMNLQVTPGLTGAELARVVGVTPQAIAPLVAKLVDRGWVERRMAPFADQLGWRPVFDVNQVLVCDDLDIVERRALKPMGIFTMLRMKKRHSA